jgi:multidrug resistance efflux pump
VSGVLVPVSGADPIQSPLVAVVDRIAVVEGQEVEAGAELFVLRSDEIRGWQTELQTLREDLRSGTEREQKLRAAYVQELAIKDAEIGQYNRELDYRGRELVTIRDIVLRLEKLRAEGYLSEIEMMQHELDVARIEKDSNLFQKSLQQARLERQKLETEQARHLIEGDAALQNFSVRIRALEDQLANSEGPYLEVKAPYRGVVISLGQRNKGTVVQAGQELCQIARLDGQPRARLYLVEESLGKIAVGQQVRLFFDAFPARRFGTITGTLDWVSPAAIASSQGTRGRPAEKEIAPDQQLLRLDERDRTIIVEVGPARDRDRALRMLREEIRR